MGVKPCINKANHALLMHGYTTFNMFIPGQQICCHYEMCTAWPQNEQSLWKLHSRDIGEKAKQNSARNNAKCSKCFQFLCNNSDRTWLFNALTFTRSLGRCWKPWPSASVFNTSHGTWRMLMHEKPCLIPIFQLLIFIHISHNLIGWRKFYTSKKVQSWNPSDLFSFHCRKRLNFWQHWYHFWWQSWNYKECIIIFVDFINV